MIQTDFIILLIAGILGSLSVETGFGTVKINWGWVVFTAWVILRLLGILA